MNDWVSAGLALLIVGLLLIALGVPMARGKVRRNVWYGYRTRRTLKDDRIWYPVNMLAGISAAVIGVLAALLGVLVMALRNRPDTAQLALSVGIPALVILLLMSIWRGWRLAQRIDQMIADQERPPER